VAKGTEREKERERKRKREMHCRTFITALHWKSSELIIRPAVLSLCEEEEGKRTYAGMRGKRETAHTHTLNTRTHSTHTLKVRGKT